MHAGFPKGVGTAIVTPMNADGALDLSSLKGLCHSLTQAGIRHLVALGTTGEATALDESERVAALEAVREAAPNAFVTVGVTAFHPEGVQRNIALSTPFADGFLLAPPPYVKPPQWELVRLYTDIADHAPRPLCVYHVPGRCAAGFAVETLDRLAQHENIQALKYADSNLEKLGEILVSRCRRWTVYSGEDALYLPMLALGIDGIISVGAHIVPQRLQEVTRQFLVGDVAGAANTFLEILPTLQTCFACTNPVAVKIWLHRLGVIAHPDLRSPLGLPPEDELQKLRKRMANCPRDGYHRANLDIGKVTALSTP